MPLGIERINARRQQPNERIVFIKPLEGPDKAFAQDFLERIAAICAPIMRANHLAVMSLEEYEPNREFVGRNFNAGEVIQLVLKAPFSGHWLPFRHVQMVMMHELAHCKQMNHSGAFWKVRNQYAGELRELWGRAYTGDGFWSRGKTLLSGQYTTTSLLDAEILPEHICGGTFRSSRGKRKRKAEVAKPKLTYAERQQRRIARKFGTKGMALGDDEESRLNLEEGKKVKGKPRVAKSARGRELRAAAALQRFGQQKKEEEDDIVKAEVHSSSDSEGEYEEVDIKQDAFDLDGSRLRDNEGHGMVRVCEDEDIGDGNTRQEMKELQQVDGETFTANPKEAPSRSSDSEKDLKLDKVAENTALSANSGTGKRASRYSESKQQDAAAPTNRPVSKRAQMHFSPSELRLAVPLACPVCSMVNEAATLTCVACSNVLDLAKVPSHWRCQSLTCRSGHYVNAGDVGFCGVCGARKLIRDGS
ncbi:MAG: hypothetical protein M1819_002694 [Sarea resinae]|nr:MAG: hypothetical protein M1819_002694 [Sarea resinae]